MGKDNLWNRLYFLFLSEANVCTCPMNTQLGHKCSLTMVENALNPLCPSEILDLIADKKDSYCIPDNQVVLFFVLRKNLQSLCTIV